MNKKRLLYLLLSIIILLYAIFKDSFISNEEIREWIGYVLKVPFVYFFCGVFFSEIKMIPLLYIVLTVIVITLFDLFDSSFFVVAKELIGYAIGAGGLWLILYLLKKQNKIAG